MIKGQKKKEYSLEFKVGAVKLVTESKIPITQAAADLGINASMLSKWVRKFEQSELSARSAFPSKGRLSPADEKLRALENELKRVTMERDILKKAMAYFVVNPK